MMKSEPPVLSRRRSHRQNPSPKSDHHTDGESSSRDDPREMEIPGTSNEEKLIKPKIKPDSLASTDELASLENKNSFIKDDKVKKWIEDSNKVMATKTSDKPTTEVEDEDEIPPIIDLPPPSVGDPKSVGLKRGRKPKTKRGVSEKKRKTSESDSEAEVKPEEETAAVVDEKENVCSSPTTTTTATTTTTSPENNNVPTEKDRTSETANTLSDFCNILEQAQKLKSHPSMESTASLESSTKGDVSPSKESAEKKKKSSQKRKRTQSTTNEDDALKSPKEKKEKTMSPPLQYKADFVSDLGKPVNSRRNSGFRSDKLTCAYNVRYVKSCCFPVPRQSETHQN